MIGREKIISGVTRLLILLLLLPVLAASAQEEGVAIFIPDATLVVDESVTVPVSINCAGDLCRALDVSFVYDPSILRIDAVTWGDYPGAGGAETLAISSAQDSQQGSIRMAYVTLQPGESRPESGTLLTIQASALASGTTTLKIANVVTGTMDGQKIDPVLLYDGTITVTPATVDSVLCDSDIDGNGVIDVQDLRLVSLAYGQTGASVLRTDINHDGSVNILDAILVSGRLGDSVEGCGS